MRVNRKRALVSSSLTFRARASRRTTASFASRTSFGYRQWPQTKSACTVALGNFTPHVSHVQHSRASFG